MAARRTPRSSRTRRHGRLLTAALAGACAVAATAILAPARSPAVASVSAGSGAHCPRTFNVYRVSRSLLAPCGVHVIPLLAEHPLPGGGKVFIYGIDGFRLRSSVPPAGFDPVSASAARLAEYGLPPRPRGGQALRSWLAAMRKAHPAKPPAFLADLHPFGTPPPRPNSPDAAMQEPTFAGNVAINETYTNVYADWLEPSIAKAECGTPQEEATWAGIGGGIATSDALLQAGTQYGENQPGTATPLAPHQAFIQGMSDKLGDILMPTNVTATVGGEMYVNIFRASSSGYDVYIENEYTGVSWDDAPWVPYSPYDGDSAEFIVEDPNGGTASDIYLIRFGTFEVEDAEASTNDATFQGLASWPHVDEEMVNPADNDVLAYAGPAFNSGDSWYDYHENCD
jgi:hypothetical protein